MKILKLDEMAKEPSRGIFWVVEDELYAFPFSGSYSSISKSGLTFNHKRLWKELSISKKPYNYYPRGRVDFSNQGKPIIYMNPNIDVKFIPQIRQEFGLRETPVIRYDYSDHYKCYLDDGFKPDKGD